MFDSKRTSKKRAHLVPLFFVEHLALTLPCFLLLPPTHPPVPPPPQPQTHTQTDMRWSSQRGFSAFATELANIYLPCIWCMSKLLQQADTEGGERGMRRESDRKAERED